MSGYNEPKHLPTPMKLPTLEDLNEGEDEAYDRARQSEIDDEEREE